MGIMNWLGNMLGGGIDNGAMHPRYQYDPKYGAVDANPYCRFKWRQSCMYSGRLDEQATQEAGYPVWEVDYRGACCRDSRKEQKACPLGEESRAIAGEAPGPPAPWLPDATIPWEDGGQRRDFTA